jgi:hypothetical protein
MRLGLNVTSIYSPVLTSPSISSPVWTPASRLIPPPYTGTSLYGLVLK